MKLTACISAALLAPGRLGRESGHRMAGDGRSISSVNGRVHADRRARPTTR